MKLEASVVVQRIDDVLREAQHVERVTRCGFRPMLNARIGAS